MTATLERSLPPVRYDHLRGMTDCIGLFEHARELEPAREHGYCVDDVSRGLVVLMREPDLDGDLVEIARTYLDFVVASQSPEGLIANRRAVDGRWTTRPALGDWWGRAIWGLGTTAARSPDPQMRDLALLHAERSMRLRAPWVRSMAFAALGAAEILTVRPHHPSATALLDDAAAIVGQPGDGGWPWPERRLSYANAAVVEALIAAGALVPDSRTLEHGLSLLEWLLGEEVVEGRLSVTPAGGGGPELRRPAFQQQPIEVAAIADACARAAEVSGDDAWLIGVELAVGWFLGHNDARLVMYDDETGGGFDGLHEDGRNPNRGAESTLAALATLQLAHRLARDGRLT